VVGPDLAKRLDVDLVDIPEAPESACSDEFRCHPQVKKAPVGSGTYR